MLTARRVAAAAFLVAAAVSFAPGVALAALDGWPAVPGVLLQAVTFVAAALLLRVPEHRADGWWLVAATVANGLSFLDNIRLVETYWLQLGWSLRWAAAACLVAPFLRLPDRPAPARAVRRLVVAAWVVLVGAWGGSSLFWDVAWSGYTGPYRWLTLASWHPVGWGLPRAVPLLFVPIAVAATVLQVRRWRGAAGPNRRAVRLLALLTLPMAWGLGARIATEVYGAPGEVVRALNMVHNGFAALALLAVLMVAVAASLRRAGFLDDLLAAAGDAPALEGVLGRHVGDPTLRLRFRTDQGWSDAAGRPLPDDVPGAGRARHVVVTERGTAAVEAELDARVDPRSRAVGPLLDAAGVVLARARLAVQHAAQAVELRASRARIVEAGVQQRRQLERDLHDGAQQHLLAAQAALSRAELLEEPDAVGRAIADARDRLATTMAELRGLARGPVGVLDRVDHRLGGNEPGRRLHHRGEPPAHEFGRDQHRHPLGRRGERLQRRRQAGLAEQGGMQEGTLP